MVRSRIKTDNDLLRHAVAGLRVASRRPNIYGYEPHDQQEIFHKSLARKKLFIGGNRSGKTVGGAAEAVFRAIGKHPYREVPPPPTYGRICSVDFKQGVEKIVRPEIARWLPPSEIKGGSWDEGYTKDTRTLELENGSFIEFMSYDQDLEKFAGTSRHWIWFDEEPPEDIWTECLLRLVDTGGDWWITMTPVEGMTWTYDQIYERSNPGSEEFDSNILVIEVDSVMNPHINPGEMDILLAGMDKDERAARERGQYVQRGGLIYPNFSEDIHVIDPIDPKELDLKYWMHFAHMDHGYTNPTSWHWSAINAEGRMIVYDEYYKTKEIVKAHAAEVLARNLQHGIPPAYSVGDPSIRNVDPITGTSIHVEYAEHGVAILLGNNDFPAGSEVVRKKFGGPDTPPSLFICRNNPHLIWELKRYRFATWANKKIERDKNPQEKPHKKNDHACDDLRYGAASRPLFEDFSVPEESDPRAGLGPVSPYHGRIDPGTVVHRDIVDDILGREW